MITLQQAELLKSFVCQSAALVDDPNSGQVRAIACQLVVALTPKPKVQNLPPVVTGMFRANRTRTIFRGIDGMEQTVDFYFQQKFGEREFLVRFAGSPAHAVLMLEPAEASGQGRVHFDVAVRNYVTALMDQDIASLRLKVTNRDS